MFLIHIPAERAGFDHWLYFHDDPRRHGSGHQVQEGVEFRDLDPEHLNAMSPVLARSETQPNSFRVFPSKLSVPLDFEILEGLAFFFPTWKAFLDTPVAKDDQWRPI